MLLDTSRILSRCSLPSTRQLIATNWNVFLQCAIPAFESLFPPEHDSVIRTLLFRLAQWHALAKLRLHTDDSLRYLDDTTRLLGLQLRKFQDFTCNAFHTMKSPSETAARWWRKDGKLGTTSRDICKSGARPKSFNLATYKLHALGDYVSTIRLFGTTDSYTTQIVSHLKSTIVFQMIHRLAPGRDCPPSCRKVLSVYKQAGSSGADCKARKMTYPNSAPM